MRSLLASAKKLGVKTQKRVCGERLVVESDGRVTGMLVDIKGALIEGVYNCFILI